MPSAARGVFCHGEFRGWLLEVVVGFEADGDGLVADGGILVFEDGSSLRADSFDRLPLVFGTGFGHPVWEGHAEVVGECLGALGSYRARRAVSRAGASGSPQRVQVGFGHGGAKLVEDLGGQTVGGDALAQGGDVAIQPEDVTEVDEGAWRPMAKVSLRLA